MQLGLRLNIWSGNEVRDVPTIIGNGGVEIAAIELCNFYLDRQYKPSYAIVPNQILAIYYH
jgi:hypothetical protein